MELNRDSRSPIALNITLFCTGFVLLEDSSESTVMLAPPLTTVSWPVLVTDTVDPSTKPDRFPASITWYADPPETTETWEVTESPRESTDTENDPPAKDIEAEDPLETHW